MKSGARCGPRWSAVSRKQCTLKVDQDEVLVRSYGANPSCVRAASSSPWATILKGKTAVLPSGGQITLDCKRIEGSVMTLERQDLVASSSVVMIAPPLASPSSPATVSAAAPVAGEPAAADVAEIQTTAPEPKSAAAALPAVATFEPWTCTACTFVHDEPEHAALSRCSLCEETRGGGRKRERAHEDGEGAGGGGGGGAGRRQQQPSQEEEEYEDEDEEDEEPLDSDSDCGHDAFTDPGHDEQKLDEDLRCVWLPAQPNPSLRAPHPSLRAAQPSRSRLHRAG